MNVDAESFLASLGQETAREARLLVSSPRNERVTHINNVFEVLDATNNRLSTRKGVTKALEAFVWPHYEYKTLHDNVKYLPRELRGEKAPKGISDLDGVGINSGSRRGSRVQGEVELFVHGHHESVDFKNKQFHPLTIKLLQHVLDPGTRRAVVMSHDSAAYGLGFDKWMPLASEFSLYDEHLASKIDLLCVNQDGVLCAIEVKVGHAETWHSSCGNMKGTGSSQVALTPLNQALVQVGVYGIIACLKYGIRNIRMVVLNVNYSGVREACVTPDFLLNVVTPIYMHMQESIKVEKEQRRIDREARKAERKQLRRYGRALPKASQFLADPYANHGSLPRVVREDKVPLHTKLRNSPTFGTGRAVGPNGAAVQYSAKHRNI